MTSPIENNIQKFEQNLKILDLNQKNSEISKKMYNLSNKLRDLSERLKNNVVKNDVNNNTTLPAGHVTPIQNNSHLHFQNSLRNFWY